MQHEIMLSSENLPKEIKVRREKVEWSQEPVWIATAPHSDQKIIRRIIISKDNLKGSHFTRQPNEIAIEELEESLPLIQLLLRKTHSTNFSVHYGWGEGSPKLKVFKDGLEKEPETGQSESFRAGFSEIAKRLVLAPKHTSGLSGVLERRAFEKFKKELLAHFNL